MAARLLDLAIIKALPTDCKVIHVEPHGKTNWAKGFRVIVEDDYTKREYFLKITERVPAKEMSLGEFESQTAIYNLIPEHAAKPLSHGQLTDSSSDSSMPPSSFYLCQFRALDAIKPTPSDLAKLLFKLHRSSVSPTGKFGFPVPAYKGYLPMDNTWCDTWEEWFARQFRLDIQAHHAIRGPDDEGDALFAELATKVIPRLLGRLESDGRFIKPSLCHTDLWHGNIHFDLESREFILFDACCLYGHHEMELGMFLHQRYGWGPEYIAAYTAEIKPSEPEEDFEDRIRLYAIRNYVVSAALWDHWVYMGESVKAEMRRLLDKHSG